MKIIEGKVISSKMKNAAVVEVTRKVAHPLYKKLLKKSKRYQVDLMGASVTIGSIVKIVETRPMSKNKHFKLLINVTPSIKEKEKK